MNTDLKRMGLFDAAALVIGAVIGSGIFLTSGLIAEYLPYSGLIILAWLAGGIVTILGALCYGELGSMFPRAGGAYVYLKEAFGLAPAFLYGWTFFIIIGAAGIAAIAMGFSEYFVSLVPAFGAEKSSFGLKGNQIVAVAALAAMTAFNSTSLRNSTRGQTTLTILRIAALAGLIVAGIVYGVKSGGRNLGRAFPSAGDWPSLTAWGAALMTALWAFDGWYSVSCAAEEIRNPRRNIPRALVLGTSFVLFLYMAVNFVYGIALPMPRLKGTVRVGEAAVGVLAGPSLAPVFTAVVALTIFGCLAANIFYCARVPYAMARDGLFFRSLGRLHPQKHVPVRALWAQAAVAVALILTGTFQKLVDYVLFGLVFFFAATGAALIRLRRKSPAVERPYRVRPYPLVPALFAAVNAAIFIALAVEQPEQAGIAAALMLSGVPAYLIWKKRRLVPPPDQAGRFGGH